MNSTTTVSALALLAAVVATAPLAAQAQDWPQRAPIHFIVPYPPGGSTDVGARVIADHLSKAIGQQVVVENRSGGSGNLGFEYGAKAAPDGYTVLIAPDQVTSAPHVFKVSFDPLRDFVPVIQLSRQPVVLAVHPSLGVGTLAELIAYVKANPGLGYATSGVGSQQHMVAEWFAKEAGIKLNHVPYRGPSQACLARLDAADPALQVRQVEAARAVDCGPFAKSPRRADLSAGRH